MINTKTYNTEIRLQKGDNIVYNYKCGDTIIAIIMTGKIKKGKQNFLISPKFPYDLDFKKLVVHTLDDAKELINNSFSVFLKSVLK